jgi:hypothetical protein
MSERDKLVIELHNGRCDYCGKVTEVEPRGFSDNGSPVTNNVCFPCQVSMSMRSNPKCHCGRDLLYSKKENIWGCLIHGKADNVIEFPDTRLFRFVRKKQHSGKISAEEQDRLTGGFP